MSETHDYIVRAFRQEDEEQVKLLVKNAFSDFLDGDFWVWKYKLNPEFNPSLIMVAEKKGAIIGCNHWLLKNFKLSPTLETKAILGADVAVLPEHRSKGVGTSLLRSLRSSEFVKSERPSVTYMFANPSLAKHFHVPAGGYVPAPDKTVSYFKILNWKKFAESASLLNAQIASGKFKSRLSKFELSVLFKISDTPPLNFSMSEKGIVVAGKEKNSKVDITVTGSLSTFQKVRTAKKRQRAIFKALLTMKLRIRGKPKQLITFYRNMWLIQEILNRKIT
jgi:GNAT superfamily N-acetyltransferase